MRTYAIFAHLTIVPRITFLIIKSNISFLITKLSTQDQDLTLGGLTPVPNVQKLIAEQGLTFTNGFVHTPVCCPSRSSYLTGRYIHNGGALNNTIGMCAEEREKKIFAPSTALSPLSLSSL